MIKRRSCGSGDEKNACAYLCHYVLRVINLRPRYWVKLYLDLSYEVVLTAQGLITSDTII